MEDESVNFQNELIAEYDREIAITRKILAAIPEGADFSFKASPKSMSLGRLAGHTSETLVEWAHSTLTTEELIFPADAKIEAYVATSVPALLEKFDGGAATSKAALAAFDPAKWDDNWKCGVGTQLWINEPKYSVWRNWVINHTIHHRAQLGVYIRLLGGTLPGTYGPSNDGM